MPLKKLSAASLPARLGATSLIAATATATGAATTIAAEAAAPIAAESTSATAAIFAWPGFIHLQHPTGEFLAVELFNRCRRFFLSRHFDEGETFRLSSVAVFNYAR